MKEIVLLYVNVLSLSTFTPYQGNNLTLRKIKVMFLFL